MKKQRTCEVQVNELLDKLNTIIFNGGEIFQVIPTYKDFFIIIYT